VVMTEENISFDKWLHDQKDIPPNVYEQSESDVTASSSTVRYWLQEAFESGAGYALMKLRRRYE
jgi:hypothetical protein